MKEKKTSQIFQNVEKEKPASNKILLQCHEFEKHCCVDLTQKVQGEVGSREEGPESM